LGIIVHRQKFSISEQYMRGLKPVLKISLPLHNKPALPYGLINVSNPAGGITEQCQLSGFLFRISLVFASRFLIYVKLTRPAALWDTMTWQLA